MTTVALIVIYNHRYDQNIDVVERIHGQRFSHIFHLVPFYTGDRPNVIPVYENSYYFQGFIAQAFRHFHHERFTHYFFIADDLILNPRINEVNFCHEIGFPPDHCFLPGDLVPFHSRKGQAWSRVAMAYEWQMRTPGQQAAQELPSHDEALRRFRRFGIAVEPLAFEQVWRLPGTWREWLAALRQRPRFCADYLLARLRGKRFHMPYPLIGGYSDIFIVTADVIRQFSHYCGVLSAMKLFVEHAIPTALVLSAKAIAGGSPRKLRGKALWSPTDMLELAPYQRSLRALLSSFPPSYLFLHPIKFSQWVADIDATTTHCLEAEAILQQSGHSSHVGNLRLDGECLALDAIGRDPYLTLPRVDLMPDKPAWVSIDITAPASTVLQLFYQTMGANRFDEELSIRRGLPVGRHVVAFALPAGLSGHFRLDPGEVEGGFCIHRLAFHQ